MVSCEDFELDVISILQDNRVVKKKGFLHCNSRFGKSLEETKCCRVVWFVQSTSRNTQNRVRVNGSFSDDFLVRLRLDQALVLTSPIFIIVQEAFFKEMRKVVLS